MRERTRKRQTFGYISGFALILAGIFLFFSAVADIPPQTVFNLEPVSEAEYGSDSVAFSEDGLIPEVYPLEMTILDVGQGLCILIHSDGRYAVYDGGGPEYSAEVFACMQEKGIDSLDYLIASHYDGEHISGLADILKTADVADVIGPAYEADSGVYTEFASAVFRKGREIKTPEPGTILTLGETAIEVLGPLSYGYTEEDNLSLPVRIVRGSFSCIITGDACSEAEYDMTRSGAELKSTVYIAGNHGSDDSGSSEFLSRVSPEYTVVSCGAGSGCPAKQTLNDLRKAGTMLYRTDVQGAITIRTDGNEVCFSCAPTSNWTPGEPDSEVPAAEEKG